MAANRVIAPSMDKIIHHTVQLHCDPRRAYEMFAVNRWMESWLTNAAEVRPVIGTKYEPFWKPNDRENNSTTECKITALEPGRLLSFE